MNNNTSRVNSISKLINKNKSNQASSLASSSNPSLVDNIISKVKNSEKQNLIIYIVVAIPILIFLIYIVYNYNFSARSSTVITGMKYKSTIKPKQLTECYAINATKQYKLCDYYICSSFMTPCVGNQHYDYVSIDMIQEVLHSGARYIQIPICESDVTINAIPVVGTAVYGQRLITSLNTLDIKLVLNTIKVNAFIVNNVTVNYPLIIHFILNTNNKTTLNILAKNILEIMSDVIVDSSKYKISDTTKPTPIYYEKLCNLLNKIIIFATPEYFGSDLESYVVPTTKLFEIYHFSELGPINVPDDIIYTNLYNNKLSGTQQRISDNYFKNTYPSLDIILDNIDTIGETVLSNTSIMNNITSFNKIGMTLVKPNYPEDVISKNYDTSESIYYGCQLSPMNFQVNDVNMQNYLVIFKESSFRLKPNSLRFSELEKPITDYNQIYQSITTVNENIINDFYSRHNNLLIAFESYTLLNTYLTQVESSLKFSVGSKITTDIYGKVTNNIGIDQLFIPRKSKIGKLTNISMYLESASNTGFFITNKSTNFYLENLASNKKDLLKQAMYIEKPKIRDNTIVNQMISMRTANDDTPLYLAFENKLVKAYANIANTQAYRNMTFIVHKIPFKYVIKIFTIYDGSVKTMSGNIIGVLENNIEDGTSYYVIQHNNRNGNNFDILTDQFTLQNKNKATYVEFDSSTKLLYDRLLRPSQNSIFKLSLQNGYYKIINVFNDNLILKDNNKLLFGTAVTNENLFKINISYELT